MIATLTGKVIHCDPPSLILEVGGVGYQVLISPRVTAKPGDDLRLFCSHQVREDSETLYGFTSFAERSVFELLLTVSGVGPKSALAILGASVPERIEAAIEQADPSLFEAIPGIGKKLAAKIIVELKGKLAPVLGGGRDDLAGALEALGYRGREIAPLLARIPDNLSDLEAKVRWALGELGKRSSP